VWGRRPRRRATRWSRLPAAALILSLSIAAAADSAHETRLPIRLGVSKAFLLNLNEDDANAAVKAWSEAIIRPTRLELDGGPQLMSSEEIVHAIAHRLLDGFAITAPEYAMVARFVDPAIVTDDHHTTEYLILVKKDSGIHDLAGLRRRSLLVYQDTTLCLAGAWLETLLAASNFEPPDRFFGRAKSSTQVSQVILPVYFGSAGACLAPRHAFDLMSELNPQLRQKLETIAVSPKLISALIGLHKDSGGEIKRRMREVLAGMSGSPRGRQILTLFQCQRLDTVDSSRLRGSIDLQAAYDRLKARRQGGGR
jgi:ABC-type phosphate/phosphonate transport system substrate-binding protein